MAGEILRSFAAPASTPFGLTWDGRALWHCDGGTDLIYQLNPRSGVVLRSFASPSSIPLGLAWDGRTLWHSDINTDLIYQLSVN